MVFLLQCTLGTNPISVAAPANDGDSFVLDMATSAVALGKVRGGDSFVLDVATSAVACAYPTFSFIVHVPSDTTEHVQ